MTPLTGGGLISAALERLGAKDPQVELSADDARQGLGILRRMVGLWNTRYLLPRVRSAISLAVTANDGTYTIGDAAHSPDFTGDRLRFLDFASITLATEPTRQIPLEIFTNQRWRSLNGETGIPRGVYVEPTVPFATIDLQPTPNESMTLNLYFKAMIAHFTDLTTEHYFDEGYEAALVSNLAVWCAGPFRINVNEDALLLTEASETRGAIASLNEGPEEMQADPHGYFSDGDSGFLTVTGE